MPDVACRTQAGTCNRLEGCPGYLPWLAVTVPVRCGVVLQKYGASPEHLCCTPVLDVKHGTTQVIGRQTPAPESARPRAHTRSAGLPTVADRNSNLPSSCRAPLHDVDNPRAPGYRVRMESSNGSPQDSHRPAHRTIVQWLRLGAGTSSWSSDSTGCVCSLPPPSSSCSYPPRFRVLLALIPDPAVHDAARCTLLQLAILATGGHTGYHSSRQCPRMGRNARHSCSRLATFSP
ncbi:hypothetical protein OH76DRAFT_213727 [Lentinus brumalis]|uniref:Uncharacterized protein n=1 Tax=Lentinus brumalis TaxID=2498619 RepID=A0A371CMM5_9APHY|nr:hypothetical protein OH76DRAFT_213727 [Polyporus brumalis]